MVPWQRLDTQALKPLVSIPLPDRGEAGRGYAGQRAELVMKMGIVEKFQPYVVPGRADPGMWMYGPEHAVEAGNAQQPLGRPAQFAAKAIAQRPLLHAEASGEFMNRADEAIMRDRVRRAEYRGGWSDGGGDPSHQHAFGDCRPSGKVRRFA